jgi:hypothetical protein
VTDGGFQVVRIRVEHRERVGGDQPGHHVSATVRAARKAQSTPAGPAERGVEANSRAHPVPSARHAESIDGDEPSGSIESVMAGRHAAE